MTVDAGNAYLKAKMNRDVFMKIDPDGRPPRQSGPNVLKVQRIRRIDCSQAREGFKRMHRIPSTIVHDNLNNKLKDLGFNQNSKDPCVFNKMFRWSAQLTVAVYVDD